MSYMLSSIQRTQRSPNLNLHSKQEAPCQTCCAQPKGSQTIVHSDLDSHPKQEAHYQTCFSPTKASKRSLSASTALPATPFSIPHPHASIFKAPSTNAKPFRPKRLLQPIHKLPESSPTAPEKAPTASPITRSTEYQPMRIPMSASEDPFPIPGPTTRSSLHTSRFRVSCLEYQPI